MNFNKTILVSLILLIISCGKTEEKKEEETFMINKIEEETDTAEEGVTNVMLTSNDQMRYNLKEIKVNAGDKVNLTLKHLGELGEEVMGHNFVLLKPGVDKNEFAKEAVDARDNEYIPENTEDVIVHTEMIGGGEQTNIEFDAPEKGVYTFICSFPGHVALMHGKFIVE